MDAANYITLGLGLATILASGVTSTVVTYRLNRNKDQFVFMREKAEALYLAADEYGKMLGGVAVSYLAVAEGHLTWDQMQGVRNEHLAKDRKHGGAETMTMLVELYFHNLKPALDGVMSAVEEFNKATHRAKVSYEAVGSLEPREWLPLILSRSNAINSAVKKFQSGIVLAARAQLKTARPSALASL